MANYYVRSGAAGAATGADWANAFLTLQAAVAVAVAGDAIWVSEDHNDYAAATANTSVTMNFAGTAASWNTVACVNHAGSVPPVAADLTTGAVCGSNGTGSYTFDRGYAYFYGITFISGSGSTSNSRMTVFGTTAGGHFIFDKCSIQCGNSNGNSGIRLQNGAAAGAFFDMRATTVKLAATSQSITVVGALPRWFNTTGAILTDSNNGFTGVVPTTLFNPVTNAGIQNVFLDGVDLSAMGAGKTIFGALAISGLNTLLNCKLGSGVTVAATPTSGAGARVNAIRCDSSALNYRHESYTFQGTQKVETTIVRTGGATDGTTPISWNFTTTANSNWLGPLESLPINIWNDGTGSNLTLTMYGIWGGGAVPNNDDIWFEVDYLGNSGAPQSSIVSASKASFLTANGAWSADASAWGGSTTPFKMTLTLSAPQPAMKGSMQVTVKAAKASSTFYVDPVVYGPTGTVVRSDIVAPGVFANELSTSGGGGGGGSSIFFRR